MIQLNHNLKIRWKIEKKLNALYLNLNSNNQMNSPLISSFTSRRWTYVIHTENKWNVKTEKLETNQNRAKKIKNKKL